MSIQTDLKEQMKEAMRAKDAVRLSVIRGLLSEFTNELVSQKKKPQEDLDDESAQKVIAREAKKRKDSIEQFDKAGRDDLSASEKEELAILDAYLPEMMSPEEVEKVVEAKKEALGVSEKKDMGKLMGAVMAEIKGKADGSDVKNAVDKSLS